MIATLVDKLRWIAASLLNRLPGMCWANLVGWALRRQTLRHARQDWACRIDAAENGSCLCGQLTGNRPEQD